MTTPRPGRKDAGSFLAFGVIVIAVAAVAGWVRATYFWSDAAVDGTVVGHVDTPMPITHTRGGSPVTTGWRTVQVALVDVAGEVLRVPGGPTAPGTKVRVIRTGGGDASMPRFLDLDQYLLQTALGVVGLGLILFGLKLRFLNPAS